MKNASFAQYDVGNTTGRGTNAKGKVLEYIVEDANPYRIILPNAACACGGGGGCGGGLGRATRVMHMQRTLQES